MRENTGTQTVTTFNFTDVPGYGLGVAHSVWTPEQAAEVEFTLGTYIDAHEQNMDETDGHPEVFEYEQAGLQVVVFSYDGEISSVVVVEDDDIARYHTAARTGRTMRIRYVKPSQIVQGPAEVSRREIEVTSVSLTKAGNIVVRAHDRRADDSRTFRADRITHTTLHRATAPSRPSKTRLAAEFRATVPAPREHVEIVTDIYLTTPGTAAALEAPEAVQDVIADRWASGHQYAFVTV